MHVRLPTAAENAHTAAERSPAICIFVWCTYGTADLWEIPFVCARFEHSVHA